jgi:hypothetical protein
MACLNSGDEIFGKYWPAFRRREMRKGKVIPVFTMKAYVRVCVSVCVWLHALLTLPLNLTSRLLYPHRKIPP